MSWPTNPAGGPPATSRPADGFTSANPPNVSAIPGSSAATVDDPAPAAAQTAAPDPDKQKPALDLLPSVSLPKGGGAIRGMGEKFSVAAATGTAGMSVPLPFSPGRAGFTPTLGLSYDSGGGNGPFGFGWSAGAATITRKTDKGLPRYDDSGESDVYILAGAEDLVPVLDTSGARKTLSRPVYGRNYQIAYYRPRVEAGFSRIERWTDTGTGVIHWRTFTRDNTCSLYGYEPDNVAADPDDPGQKPCSVVADPNHPTKIFSWKICRSFDDKGNLAVYTYRRDDDTGIDATAAHESNRIGSRATQIYLKTILYGNTAPYFADRAAAWAAPTEPPLPDASEWLFKVVFDYGDHNTTAPTPTPDAAWPVRPDPFSTYRPGFEVRTYRRVQRVLFFNNFPHEQTTAGADYLVRSVDLQYSDQQTPTDPRNPSYTMLVSATQTGHRLDPSGGPVSRSLPPLEFTYSTAELNSEVLSLDRDSLGNLPEGIDGTRFRWVDLDGEGCSGILTDAGGAWYYKRNLSPDNLTSTGPDGSGVARAHFGPLETVAAIPSRSDLAGVKLLDLSGGGRLDVVDLTGPAPGFFERTEDANFAPLQRFAALPQLDWSDPNVTFIDVTGDGLADIMITDDNLYTVHASLCGAAGFDSAQFVRPGWDEEKGPAVILADGTDTIFTADMSGDGLSDIVRVRNGESCYWPNIGYGRFGAKVTMDDAPRFDNEAQFDPARIRLADIDGTGTADLLYMGAQGVQAWFNQSGNAWSAPTTIGVFPTADRISSVQVLDLLGTGTACLIWSSPLPGNATAPMLYVDLMGGNKPHLLTGTRNNLGAETRVTYAPSTRFSVHDEQAGAPWITTLPFPVQVVERVETYDWIGLNRLVTCYSYHHGYYDMFEREFRGFGRVDQWDTDEFRTDTQFPDVGAETWENLDEQSWSPPVLTRTWFHTGAFTEAAAVTRQYQSEYWIEPALLQAAAAADQQPPSGLAAMQIPDTVIPDDLADAFEVQEAYRALKGQPLRVEVYADDSTTQATDADFGVPSKANPYTVTEQNFTIQCLQHRGPNLHAAFYTHPRESVSFHYERSGDDPRVGHDVVLEVDDYGNVERSVSIGYPRRPGYSPPEPTLSETTQQMLTYDQTRLHIRGAEHDYTNAIDQPDPSQPHVYLDDYRARLLASSLTAEMTGVPGPTGKAVPGTTTITDLYSYDEIDAPNPPAGGSPPPGFWTTTWTTTADIPYEHIPYEQIPGSDVDGAGSPATTPTRRALVQHQIQYRSDDLTELLPVGQLQPRALPGQSYNAALTPSQLSAIFGTLVTTATLTEGGYVQQPPDSSAWWVPSGRLHYSPNDTDTPATELAWALAHFFAPYRAVDPFSATAYVGYDNYTLLATSATDRVGNTTTATPDYRVLAPATVTDPNGNHAKVAFDVLGLPTATAVMGKTSQTLGDQLPAFTPDLDHAALIAQFTDPLTDPAGLLGDATTRTIYDVDAYARTAGNPQPAAPAVYTLARETHVSDLANPPYPGAPQTTRYQYHFSYSDGLSRQIQTKTLGAPGPLTPGDAPVPTRWVCSGWTILDNKGRPVRNYEPFFTATNAFEPANQTGVSSVLFYDPPGRVIATLNPDNTWAKTVYGVTSASGHHSFNPWLTQTWDGDDTVITDPTTDPDVGDYFTRYQTATGITFVSWYTQQASGTQWQQDAAQKAAAAANTPTTTHADALGRACLTVVDNGNGNRYPSRTAYDTEGTPLAVFDALDRRAEEHCYREPQPGAGFTYLAGNDMAGNPLYHISADAGARRSLNNVAGQPIRAWDARGHAFRTLYDPAQRPTQRYVSTDGAPEILLDYAVYGEGQPEANLCGQVFRHYDTAGYQENTIYDYKGNLLSSVHQLASDYQTSPDWTPLAGLTDPAQLDTAAIAAGLIPTGDGGRDTFTAATTYDALNRPTQQVTPYNPTMKPDVIQPGYDQGAKLITLDAWLQQAAAPTTLLDPTTADQHTLTGIDYNARGQRLQTSHGNGATTAYTYDPATFRLAGLTTTRPTTFAADQQTVQDLSYYYDAVGNITHIQDDADTQNVIFFNNQRIEPSATYSYDPLYRLISATGREHLGQTAGANGNLQLSAPQQITNDDSFRMSLPQPGDGNAMGTYTETYEYDQIGNIKTMAHTVISGGWTRNYSYAEASQIVASETCNQLTATSLPGDPTGGPYSATYTHDQHGNMTQMPHLPVMTSDEDDRMRSTIRTVATTGITPQTTFYCYDSGAQRVRKVINAQTPAGQAPARASERIYLGATEIYREYGTDGTTITLERETVHLNEDQSAVALIETRTTGTDKYLALQVRYQYGNHLGSAVLELDDQANILTYEEYFPYGSTAYQSVTAQTEVPKRYRYTGKERDQENDLSYHGARYYVPWLGRWTACDPGGISTGLSRYDYVHNSPVLLVDLDGMAPEPSAPNAVSEEGSPTLPKFLNFSHFFELNPARKALLKYTFNIPFREPTDPAEKEDWQRGENIAAALVIAEVVGGALGGGGPEPPPTPEVAGVAGPAAAVGTSPIPILPPNVFANALSEKKKTASPPLAVTGAGAAPGGQNSDDDQDDTASTYGRKGRPLTPGEHEALIDQLKRGEPLSTEQKTFARADARYQYFDATGKVVPEGYVVHHLTNLQDAHLFPDVDPTAKDNLAIIDIPSHQQLHAAESQLLGSRPRTAANVDAVKEATIEMFKNELNQFPTKK